MIISHLRRFVYIGPPRTGTTTLHNWMSQPGLCESRCEPQCPKQHSATVPPGAADYFTLASIRHPLARAVSLWKFLQQAEPADVQSMDFAEFVDWLPTGTPFYRSSQARLLRKTRIDAFVRTNQLASDLANLPPVIDAGGMSKLEPLPMLNATQSSPWWTHYTDSTARTIRDMWADDFALWDFANAR